jgi:hypothetical protein
MSGTLQDSFLEHLYPMLFTEGLSVDCWLLGALTSKACCSAVIHTKRMGGYINRQLSLGDGCLKNVSYVGKQLVLLNEKY